MHPPLTDWLEEDGTVTIDYHTNVEGTVKARFRLDILESERLSEPDRTEGPVRLALDPIDD